MKLCGADDVYNVVSYPNGVVGVVGYAYSVDDVYCVAGGPNSVFCCLQCVRYC